MTDPIGTILADLLGMLLPPDGQGQLDTLKTELNIIQKVANRMGGREARFDRIFAESGYFSQLPHEAAILSSLSAPHATLTNNVDTTIQGMSGTVQRLGLKVDETDFSYIEFAGIPNESLFLWNFTVDFAVSSVGDRELRYREVDEVRL